MRSLVGSSTFAILLPLNRASAADIKSCLPPTDSRLRPDQRAFEEGDVTEAENLKAALEVRQRSRRPELEGKLLPRWFEKDSAGRWQYKVRTLLFPFH